MKRYFTLSILILLAISFTSCCGIPLLGKGCAKKSTAHCGEYIKTTVTELQEVTQGSSKGESYTTQEIVTREVNTPVTCPECTTKFKPCDKCCGGVGNEVVRRASAQGWSGNPHIGLIPTMKVLAE